MSRIARCTWTMEYDLDEGMLADLDIQDEDAIREVLGDDLRSGLDVLARDFEIEIVESDAVTDADYEN